MCDGLLIRPSHAPTPEHATTAVRTDARARDHTTTTTTTDGTTMSGTSTAGGRHRASRRHRWVLPLALALVVAVGTALLGSAGTYALWNQAASTAPLTVRSGTATLSVSQLVMSSAPLAPGTGSTGTVTITNTGSVPLTTRVTTTSARVSGTSTASAAVLAEVTLRWSVVSSAAACRAGLTATSGRAASFDSGVDRTAVPVGGQRLGCVEVVLDADAPQGVAGAGVDVALTVTGTQVAS